MLHAFVLRAGGGASRATCTPTRISPHSLTLHSSLRTPTFTSFTAGDGVMCTPLAAGAAAAPLLNLVSASPAALAALFARAGAPAYRTAQVLRAVHRAPRAGSLAALTGLSLAERAALAAVATLDRGALADEARAADGTVKWLVSLPGAQSRLRVETVFIPPPPLASDGAAGDSDDDCDDDAAAATGGGRLGRGGTLCVSSQAGCSLACTFCHTGTQALEGNVPAAGIVGQVHLAADRLAALGRGDHIRNVVFMGMGEPLLNARAVREAIALLVDRGGLALAPRRITVSTAGVVPALARAAEELPPGVRLAVSLHAADDALRSRLMNVNKMYGGVEPLLAAVRAFALRRGAAAPSRAAKKAARVTFEYAMLAGVNDAPAQARALAALLLRHLPPHCVHVNLLPFHPWPGAAFAPSPPAHIAAFQAVLADLGLRVHVRASRGLDILAACGQLRSAGAGAKRAGTAAAMGP